MNSFFLIIIYISPGLFKLKSPNINALFGRGDIERQMCKKNMKQGELKKIP